MPPTGRHRLLFVACLILSVQGAPVTYRCLNPKDEEVSKEYCEAEATEQKCVRHQKFGIDCQWIEVTVRPTEEPTEKPSDWPTKSPTSKWESAKEDCLATFVDRLNDRVTTLEGSDDYVPKSEYDALKNEFQSYKTGVDQRLTDIEQKLDAQTVPQAIEERVYTVEEIIEHNGLTLSPTSTPTEEPTAQPTQKPTYPTQEPTRRPTQQPTAACSREPFSADTIDNIKYKGGGSCTQKRCCGGQSNTHECTHGTFIVSGLDMKGDDQSKWICKHFWTSGWNQWGCGPNPHDAGTWWHFGKTGHCYRAFKDCTRCD